jgi:hypothetical protein
MSDAGILDAKSLVFVRVFVGPGGGSRTHTGSDPRQILSLLRLPVPPLRENTIENSMRREAGKAGGSPKSCDCQVCKYTLRGGPFAFEKRRVFNTSEI